ncbi:hypothetical protein AJ78_03706 [Emergomyces pasteurianus Ep9510]|uniref:Uncharacterized protein n=1 Tax=Emergomyces pasteurianus Ep9510 TaxID=1447872 RepID=A0A1J9PJB1_9EURO|nr:hypothetical protein AJ78_03706 [Emergomyces pasteurianus Ep9510]
MAPSRLAHVWARNATSKPTDRSKLPPSDHWEGDALWETLDKQECIIVPLSQVKILKLVFKRDRDEMLSTCSAKNISHTFLTLADDPIIIDESMSPTNLPCGFDQFVAIPSLQRNIEKVPGGYKVYANMTLNDLQELGGWNCWQFTTPGTMNVAERGHVDYICTTAGRWFNLSTSS